MPTMTAPQQHPPADCSPPTAAPPPTFKEALAGPAATGADAIRSVRRREGRGSVSRRHGCERERGRGEHTFDLLSHGQERLLHVRRILGRSFQHGHSNTLGKVLGHIIIDHLLGRQIALVAHEEFVDPLAGIAINLLKPLLDVGEGVGVGYVVDDNDAVRAAVVRRGDGAESLLTGCVPLLVCRGGEDGDGWGERGKRWSASCESDKGWGGVEGAVVEDEGRCCSAVLQQQAIEKSRRRRSSKPNRPPLEARPPECIVRRRQVSPSVQARRTSGGEAVIPYYSTTLVKRRIKLLLVPLLLPSFLSSAPIPGVSASRVNLSLV